MKTIILLLLGVLFMECPLCDKEINSEINSPKNEDIEINQPPKEEPPPPIFGVIIENGADSTETRIVNLDFCAPISTTLMIISNTDNFLNSHWQDFEKNIIWELSGGAGMKIVSVQFRNKDNHQTKIYSDQIYSKEK